MSSPPWDIGLEVNVLPRTWPGINKPGGHGKIVNIHYSSLGVVDSLDVRYTLGNHVDTALDTDFVKPHVQLDRGRRHRRGRDIFASEYQRKTDACKKHQATWKPATDEKENDDPDSQSQVAMQPVECVKDPFMTIKTEFLRRASSPPPNACPEEFPEKKRSKSNGKLAPIAHDTKKTPTASAAFILATSKENQADYYHRREGVPEFVVTNLFSAPSALSPLPVGKAGNIDNPAPFSFLSGEDPPDTSIRADASFGRNTLKHLFADQRQKSACYSDTIVGRANAKNSLVKLDEVRPPMPPPFDEERCQEFTRIFSNAMRQNDWIPKDDMFCTVNQLAPSLGCKSFAVEEMDLFVTKLISDDKVMLSDGCFYAI